MLHVDIAVPAEDLQRLNDRLGRYVTFHKENAQKAIERTAVKLALALRASTKGTREVIKMRPVVKNPLYTKSQDKRDRMKEHISDYYTVERKRPDLDFVSFSDKSFRFQAKKSVYRIKKSKRIFMPVRDNTKGAAKDSPLRIVKKRGLADKSWFWMLGRMGQKTPDPGAGLTARGEVISVTKTSAGNTFSINLTNKLPYIRKALKENVNTILQRVDKMLWYEMLDATQKALVKAKRLHYPG